MHRLDKKRTEIAGQPVGIGESPTKFSAVEQQNSETTLLVDKPMEGSGGMGKIIFHIRQNIPPYPPFL
jgi:hypothetical protein